VTDARVHSTRNELLFVVTGLGRGGTERHLLQVLPQLRAAGFDPLVYSLTGRGAIGPELEAAGIEVRCGPLAETQGLLRPLRLAAAFAGLCWLLIRRRPALLHCFLPAAYILGGTASLLLGPRLRVMSRRSLNAYQAHARGAGWLERRLHRHMAAVLGNSRAVVAQLLQEGVAPEKLALIYNGIELPRPVTAADRVAVRTRLGVTADALVLILIANLIPYKGHRDLLEALGQIKAKLPAGWRLLLAGRDDGIGEELKRQADGLGLSEHLIWLGERTDVAQLIAASDMGLLCSHEEGFSNAILECMAAALPMVVTDVGGNAEAVVEGTTGWVVPPRAPERLARAILALAGDPAQRLAFGEAGKARVMAEFSRQAMVRDYLRLYTALLAGRPPPIEPDTHRVGVAEDGA